MVTNLLNYLFVSAAWAVCDEPQVAQIIITMPEGQSSLMQESFRLTGNRLELPISIDTWTVTGSQGSETEMPVNAIMQELGFQCPDVMASLSTDNQFRVASAAFRSGLNPIVYLKIFDELIAGSLGYQHILWDRSNGVSVNSFSTVNTSGWEESSRESFYYTDPEQVEYYLYSILLSGWNDKEPIWENIPPDLIDGTLIEIQMGLLSLNVTATVVYHPVVLL